MKLKQVKAPLDPYVVASRNGVRLSNPKQSTDEVDAEDADAEGYFEESEMTDVLTESLASSLGAGEEQSAQ